MAKQVTTLFIEDTAIRLLVGRGKQVEKWASLPLEPGLVKHGLIQDNVRVAEKIKELFRLTKVSRQKGRYRSERTRFALPYRYAAQITGCHFTGSH